MSVGGGAEDGIRDLTVTGVQTCALPILVASRAVASRASARRSHLVGPGRGHAAGALGTQSALAPPAAMTKLEIGVVPAKPALAQHDGKLEIGRASCRERV